MTDNQTTPSHDVSEPRGAWVGEYVGGFLTSPNYYVVAVVTARGWLACRPTTAGWDAHGPETGAAGRLAAEAWLDANGVGYST